MESAMALEHLANRLIRVENELRLIRGELTRLQQQAPSRLLAYAWVDKDAQKRRMNEIFAALGIQGASIGIQALQARMAQAALSPNELSQALIDAREE